jgi:ATP-binding cassette subfamily B protein RaxB
MKSWQEDLLGATDGAQCEHAVHDDIAAMPMGYRALAGDMGSSLSGGQQQSVLLARALCKKPKVLALDEATSHLDIANEQRVTHALAQMNLTRIIAAHRHETIAGAQRVVGLQQSKLFSPTGPNEYPKEIAP